MEPITLLDTVALMENLPAEGLVRGQMGTVVEVFNDGACEVEFSDRNGETYAQLALKPSQLLRLIDEPQPDLQRGLTQAFQYLSIATLMRSSVPGSPAVETASGKYTKPAYAGWMP